MIENYTLNHEKDNNFYIINEDTGEQYSYVSEFNVLEYAKLASYDEESNPAEFDTEVWGIEYFDNEGMKVGDINPNHKLGRWIKEVMEGYFQEEADEMGEDW